MASAVRAAAPAAQPTRHDRLKAATDQAHAQAEAHPFIVGLLAAKPAQRAALLPSYQQHLTDEHLVHSTLEHRVLARQENAFVRAHTDAGRFVASKLQEDIEVLGGRDAPSPPAKAFAAYIAGCSDLELSAVARTLVLARAFGGGFLKTPVQSVFGAVRSYEHKGVVGTNELRFAINRMSLSDKQEAEFIGAARLTFAYSEAMFESAYTADYDCFSRAFRSCWRWMSEPTPTPHAA